MTKQTKAIIFCLMLLGLALIGLFVATRYVRNPQLGFNSPATSVRFGSAISPAPQPTASPEPSQTPKNRATASGSRVPLTPIEPPTPEPTISIRPLKPVSLYFAGETIGGYTIPQGMKAVLRMKFIPGPASCNGHPREIQPCLVELRDYDLVMFTCLKEVPCDGYCGGQSTRAVPDITCEAERVKYQ